jgi:hypothetical protein
MKGVATIIPIDTEFERLTVIGLYYTVTKQGKSGIYKRRYYPCRCTCGTEKGIPPSELTSGRTRSCGCLHRELLPLSCRTHGGTRSPLYLVLMNMIARCNDPSIGESYKNYGGRGITICEEWRHDFAAFREWAMANGYKPGWLC